MNFVRTYCEGGLTSADYRHNFTFYPALLAYRLILSCLMRQRAKLLADDHKNNLTSQQKLNTLVIEWSGGNDLIKVNLKPTYHDADKAILARIDNVEKLFAAGYRHFVLVTVPNFSITPRYQGKSETERREAKVIVDYLNSELE